MCFMCLVYIYFSCVSPIVIFNFQFMMINEKSAMTVWWCKRMYSLTGVLRFVEKNNVLLKKNSLLAGTSCKIKLGTAVETTSWRAWSRCQTPAAETLQRFRPRLLVWLVANIGGGKDGSDRRTGHLHFETVIFIWSYACSVHFQPVSCMYSRCWSCWR